MCESAFHFNRRTLFPKRSSIQTMSIQWFLRLELFIDTDALQWLLFSIGLLNLISEKSIHFSSSPSKSLSASKWRVNRYALCAIHWPIGTQNVALVGVFVQAQCKWRKSFFGQTIHFSAIEAFEYQTLRFEWSGILFVQHYWYLLYCSGHRPLNTSHSERLTLSPNRIKVLKIARYFE